MAPGRAWTHWEPWEAVDILQMISSNPFPSKKIFAFLWKFWLRFSLWFIVHVIYSNIDVFNLGTESNEFRHDIKWTQTFLFNFSPLPFCCLPHTNLRYDCVQHYRDWLPTYISYIHENSGIYDWCMMLNFMSKLGNHIWRGVYKNIACWKHVQ